MATLQTILKPIEITVGQNVNYTVPVGRIARFNYTMNLNADVVPVGLVGSTVFNNGNNSKIESGSLILRAGDIISSTRSTGAGTTNTTGSGVAIMLTRTAVASVTLLINTVASKLINIAVSCTRLINAGDNGSSVAAITSTGAADLSFVIEEYLE